MSARRITVEWWAGTGINDAVRELIEIADATGRWVLGSFNGVTFEAKPGQMPESVAAAYREALAARPETDGGAGAHRHAFNHFSRTLCACGVMHTYCDCSQTAEPCQTATDGGEGRG